jgi:hypothetical protein
MEDPYELLDTDSVLKPFLEAVQESVTNVSTLRAIVLKVLSHSHIFCGFDELKALIVKGGVDDAALLATLDLFSYGTIQDYSQSASMYLPLNDTQLSKLRQLTLLTCVQQACQNGDSTLSYETLREALGLLQQEDDNNNNNNRALEQVLIACLYVRVLNGKLCQKSQRLLLTTVPVCCPRDVPLSNIATTLLAQFQALQQRLEASHGELQTAQTSVSNSLEQTANYWKSVEEKKNKAQNQVQNHHQAPSSSNSGGVGGGGSASGNVRFGVWPEANTTTTNSSGVRRSSASRNSKRSRGGLGGSFTEPFQRY